MKKINRLLLIIMLAFLPVILMCQTRVVRADSGWDTSYDSGSSWSSGSSWDSSPSWDSGSSWGSGSHHYSGGSSDTLEDFITLVLVIFFIIGFVTPLITQYIRKNSGTGTRVNVMNEYSDISEDELKQLLPDTTMDDLKQTLYDDFLAIQNAWTDFDYDKLRELCTDELYNTYVSQLDVLKLKNGKNIMSNFELYAIRIVSVEQDKDTIAVKVYMNVSFYDYVMNTKEHRVERGSANRPINNNYMMTFVRTNDKAHKIDKCPNCGASISDSASSKCEYCGSTIVKSSYEFVLSKKTNINK